MVKSHKDKVVHKAMKSIDKLYNEVPGNYKHVKLYPLNILLFSVRWYFWRGNLVPVLFYVCLLHHSLCFSIIQVKYHNKYAGILHFNNLLPLSDTLSWGPKTLWTKITLVWRWRGKLESRVFLSARELSAFTRKNRRGMLSHFTHHTPSLHLIFIKHLYLLYLFVPWIRRSTGKWKYRRALMSHFIIIDNGCHYLGV